MGFEGSHTRYSLLTSLTSNRKQFTTIEGTKSELLDMLWGVPQGSVLGPLLFILFINDLPKSSSMNTWLFADDTALAKSSTSFTDLQEKMNFEIGKVQDWLLANKLSVHYVDKTQYILFIPQGKVKQKPPDFSLFMGGNLIEQTSTYKYLEVLIDEKLN